MGLYLIGLTYASLADLTQVWGMKRTPENAWIGIMGSLPAWRRVGTETRQDNKKCSYSHYYSILNVEIYNRSAITNTLVPLLTSAVYSVCNFMKLLKLSMATQVNV